MEATNDITKTTNEDSSLASSAPKKKEEEDEEKEWDVWRAAAYGNQEKLEFFVNNAPSSSIIIDAKDANGFRPLQWAALNNRVAIAGLVNCVCDRVRFLSSLHLSNLKARCHVASSKEGYKQTNKSCSFVCLFKGGCTKNQLP